MVFGKKYMDKDLDERGFKAVIHEIMQLGAASNLGDYIPCLAPLDPQGLTRRMKAVSKIFDDFFEKIIDEHVQSKDESKSKDFVDVMLSFMGSEESEYRIERSNIKAIILVIIHTT
jgi:cytochrome P450